MILALDLDDTLYPERSYVDSGLAAVARWAAAEFGWPAQQSLELMTQVLESEGRGLVFDRLLAARGRHTRTLVERCVAVYRGHRPQLALYSEGRRLLERWTGPLYLVTDGHKGVQQRKVDALGIEARFAKVYITHRYGRQRAKPSVHCFERIRQREGCNWCDIAYVGDNPAKDFVNLRPLGARTVRVLTGGHRDVRAAPGHDAAVSIASLDALEAALAAQAD